MIVQTTKAIEGGATALITTLAHTSGQFISGEYPLCPAKSDPQGQGSALTYARRYALSAILGIVTDEDDDAESAMNRPNVNGKKSNIPTSSTKKASPAQISKLWSSAKERGFSEESLRAVVLKDYKVSSLHDLTMTQASEIISKFLLSQLVA
jgi:hypothetical protein